MRFSSPQSRDPLPWLTSALYSVAAAQVSEVIAVEAAWGCQPDRRHPDPEAFYPGGIGVHPYTEFCISLSGEAVMNVESRRFALRSPRWVILPPGRPHVEAYADRDQAYTVMWLSAKGDLATVGVSHYAPDKGWSIQARSHLKHGAVRRLTMSIEAGEQWTKHGGFESVRQGLLTVLCALQVRMAERATVDRARRPRGRHAGMIEHIRQLLNDDPRAELSLSQLAEMARMTPNYLNTLFRRQVGQSIHAYRQTCRMDEARRLLRSTNLLVKEVAYRLGFDDPLYFSRAYHRRFGVWPSEQ